jgi:glyoxylase I family protein
MATPIRIDGFDHIVLRVRDKSAALAFYEGVLGLPVDRDRPELGLTHIRAGRQMIDLVTLDGPLGSLGGAAPGAEGRNLDHFALQVRPFDEAAIRAHLARLGVAPAFPSMCGIRMATRSN